VHVAAGARAAPKRAEFEQFLKDLMAFIAGGLSAA
jgi:hypothetical protein